MFKRLDHRFEIGDKLRIKSSLEIERERPLLAMSISTPVYIRNYLYVFLLVKISFFRNVLQRIELYSIEVAHLTIKNFVKTPAHISVEKKNRFYILH